MSFDRFTSCLCFTHLLCLPLFMEKGAALDFHNIPVKKKPFVLDAHSRLFDSWS